MKIKLLIVLVALSSVAMALSRNFYFCPSGGAGIAVTNRVGQRASVGWVVQPIANVNDVTYPPTTNGPHYIDTQNGEQYFDGVGGNQTNIMGYENVAGTLYVGDGEGSWGTFKPGDGYGYIRFFSSFTVTGAAYYADSSRHSLTEAGDPDVNTDVVVIAQVNPAYVIPGFGVAFPTNGHVEQDTTLLGNGGVATTPAGGANQLADSMVSVRWENVTLGTSGYVAVNSGTWAGEIPLLMTPPIWTTNVLRFIAVGISARTGLPVSQEETRYVLGIPEPGTMMWVLAGLLTLYKAPVRISRREA